MGNNRPGADIHGGRDQLLNQTLIKVVFTPLDLGTNKTASATLLTPYISTCVPSSITRFNGNLKYLRLLLAFLSKKAKRLSRQRAIPMRLVGITVSRLRK
jgi:hypothetical protein